MSKYKKDTLRHFFREKSQVEKNIIEIQNFYIHIYKEIQSENGSFIADFGRLHASTCEWTRQANVRPARFRVLLLNGGDSELAHMQLAVAVQLYGFDGAAVMLDPLMRRHGVTGARRMLRDLADRCRKSDAVLVLLAQRKTAASSRLLSALQPCDLGRRRRTTSTPAISMPSGGVGRRLTSTSWLAMSISFPSPSMKKWK